MKHLITKVDNGSIAEELGIKQGWKLVSVGGEIIRDVIDYELFTNSERITVLFESDAGELYEFDIEKEPWESLGLNFESGLMSPVRQCTITLRSPTYPIMNFKGYSTGASHRFTYPFTLRTAISESR